MPSKLQIIAIRLDQLSFRKFHYIAHMNGRFAAQEGRLIFKRYIDRYERKHGTITLDKLEELEDRLDND